jgi:hypothetical protein
VNFAAIYERVEKRECLMTNILPMLVLLLEDWSITHPGVFLYHPSRRQTPLPLQVFLRFVEKWRKQSRADPVALTNGGETSRKIFATAAA